MLSKYKNVRRLRELKDLFSFGLREISDAIISEKIIEFNSEEIQKIIEARFERTQLRESISKSIAKALEV